MRNIAFLLLVVFGITRIHSQEIKIAENVIPCFSEAKECGQLEVGNRSDNADDTIIVFESYLPISRFSVKDFLVSKTFNFEVLEIKWMPAQITGIQSVSEVKLELFANADQLLNTGSRIVWIYYENNHIMLVAEQGTFLVNKDGIYITLEKKQKKISSFYFKKK